MGNSEILDDLHGAAIGEESLLCALFSTSVSMAFRFRLKGVIQTLLLKPVKYVEFAIVAAAFY
jgi:hypothetical protein